MGFAVSSFASSGTKIVPSGLSSGANVGLICGLVFGGLALIMIAVGVTFYIKKRNKADPEINASLTAAVYQS